MKKILALLVAACVCCFASQIEIVATSSLIATVAKEIGGKNIKTSVMIPPGICPGHYEVKPNDIKKLCDGGIMMYHGWEGFIEDIAKAVSGETTKKMFKIDVQGSWLIPEVQKKAAEKISLILEEIDPSSKNFYQKNLLSYKKKMTELENKIKKFVSENGLAGKKVVCSEMQKEFLTYLGLDVIDSFGRDEDISPGTITRIINNIKNKSVKIVVSNLQSGTSTGKMLAEKTGAIHIVFSNFPGGFENTKTIEDTVFHNLKLLKEATIKNN